MSEKKKVYVVLQFLPSHEDVENVLCVCGTEETAKKRIAQYRKEGRFKAFEFRCNEENFYD